MIINHLLNKLFTKLDILRTRYIFYLIVNALYIFQKLCLIFEWTPVTSVTVLGKRLIAILNCIQRTNTRLFNFTLNMLRCRNTEKVLAKRIARREYVTYFSVFPLSTFFNQQVVL